MEKLPFLGRCFYGIGIAGIGIQHFIYSEFRPMLLAYWPSSFPAQSTFAYLAGAGLILAGAAIIFSKRATMLCHLLGIFFLLLFICSHVYTLLFLVSGDFELAAWTNPLKELAFSGGAFIIAASYPEERPSTATKLLTLPGIIFFAIMLIVFGIAHFQYAKFVAMLVPDWIPGHMFWTYAGAVALIGSGVCILFKVNIRLVALLCGLMLFLWLVLLHIPRAIADPHMAKGNEITSVFQALAFSGIALVIAWLYRTVPPSHRKQDQLPVR